MTDLSALIDRVEKARRSMLMDRLANEIPQLKRGMVWCTVCGRSQRVNSADALRNGWPKCHGYTMTIDSPDERALKAKQATDA